MLRRAQRGSAQLEGDRAVEARLDPRETLGELEETPHGLLLRVSRRGRHCRYGAACALLWMIAS